MRIIAGTRRGKKLFTPEGDAIRPTSDRARAAIFSILGSQVWVEVGQTLPQGARVLDLACGTGALACEALSRGAASAVLYDSDARSLALAKKNIGAIGAEALAEVAFGDLARLPKTAHAFDLVFFDPPYGQGDAAKGLGQLLSQGYLHAGSLVVVETGADEALTLSAGLRLFDSRRYGAAKIWFLGIEA